MIIHDSANEKLQANALSDKDKFFHIFLKMMPSAGTIFAEDTENILTKAHGMFTQYKKKEETLC